jgi:hypothetical protein
MIFLPVGPRWLEAGIHGTLVVETLIPLLLAFRGSRGAGVLLGVWFHSFLSSGPRNGFFAFAVVIFPLLWLFASEEALARLGAIVRRVFGSRIDASAATLARGGILSAIALASLASARLEVNRTFPAWITYDAIVLAWACAEVWSGVRATGDRRVGLCRCGDPVLMVMPVVFFLNGACPYLGLKTETSFAMYSNLRTEGGRSNHLLSPADVAPFRFQEDLVEIIDSSDTGLRGIANSGMFLTWFDLRDLPPFNGTTSRERICGQPCENVLDPIVPVMAFLTGNCRMLFAMEGCWSMVPREVAKPPSIPRGAQSDPDEFRESKKFRKFGGARDSASCLCSTRATGSRSGLDLFQASLFCRRGGVCALLSVGCGPARPRGWSLSRADVPAAGELGAPGE